MATGIEPQGCLLGETARGELAGFDGLDIRGIPTVSAIAIDEGPASDGRGGDGGRGGKAW